MSVTKYAVQVISPENGSIVWFDSFLFASFFPLFTLTPPPGISFRLAHDVSVTLRLFYPLVKVVGVYA